MCRPVDSEESVIVCVWLLYNFNSLFFGPRYLCKNVLVIYCCSRRAACARSNFLSQASKGKKAPSICALACRGACSSFVDYSTEYVMVKESYFLSTKVLQQKKDEASYFLKYKTISSETGVCFRL